MLEKLKDAGISRMACAWLVAILMGVFAAADACASLDAKEMNTLLKEGEDLFRQANTAVGKDPEAAKALYGKAVMRFERIAGEGGVRNGGLYYNIGNSYFRMEDLGRAILNYRRAELCLPNDENIRRNLDYARSKRPDQVEVRQQTKVLNTLFFWHYDLSTRTRALLFAVFFVLIWAIALLRIRLRRPWTGWALGVSIFLAVMFLGSVVVEARAMRARRPAVVVSREVIARKGDSETYEPSFTEPLHSGTEVDVIEQRPDWRQVELADGRSCWVPLKSVELVQ